MESGYPRILLEAASTTGTLSLRIRRLEAFTLMSSTSIVDHPQYIFDIDDNDDECLFQLTQKCERGGTGDDKTTIGFSIMKVIC
jgi:hypothetical protein